MWRINLKIVGIVIGTLAVYTAVANVIPQVQSDVPQAMAIGADVTTEQLVSIGEELYNGAGGCTACHGLGTRAPSVLGTAGTVCGDRVPGMECKEYLHQSLVDPGAHVVEGFQPIMPDMSRTLTGQQIWALVAFLQSQGGEVTVTPDDVAPAGGGTEPTEGVAAAAAGVTDTAGAAAGAAATAAGTAGAGAPAAGSAATDPRQLVQDLGCIACHQLEGEGAAVGPAFSEMRGKPEDYLRRGILQPAADTAPGYEQFAGTMPPNFGDRLTASQLETLLDFLTGGER